MSECGYKKSWPLQIGCAGTEYSENENKSINWLTHMNINYSIDTKLFLADSWIMVLPGFCVLLLKSAVLHIMGNMVVKCCLLSCRMLSS